MDLRCLEHRLTEAERCHFDEQGYLILDEALTPKCTDELTDACDRLIAETRHTRGLEPHDAVDVADIIDRDPAFLKLIDLETTFPKAWGILGWNICIYHSGLLVTPPVAPQRSSSKATVAWHQDSMRVNDEIGVSPRPRLSIKLFYFASDMSESGRGNTLVVPGSHLLDEIDVPEDGQTSPDGAIPICAPRGGAAIIDRRIWHSRSVNRWHGTRVMLMMGYSFRWLLPKDDMTVAQLYGDLDDPIRSQLLRDNPSNNSTYAPEAGEVPLRDWLTEHCPEDADWSSGKRQSYRPDIPNFVSTAT